MSPEKCNLSISNAGHGVGHYNRIEQNSAFFKPITGSIQKISLDGAERQTYEKQSVLFGGDTIML